MKDKEQNFRGACSSCSCPEYEFNPNSSKCQDCNCSVTRHKITTAGKGDTSGGFTFSTPTSIIISTIGFFLWIGAVSYLVYLKSSGIAKDYSAKFDRGIGDQSYVMGAFIAGMGMSFTMIYSNAQNPDRRKISVVMFYLLSMYFATYLLMIFRATPTWVGNGGSITDPLRYLEWLIAMPVLISLIAEITNSRMNVFSNSVLITSQTVFAFFAQIMREPYAEWAAIIAWLSFIPVAINLWYAFEDAISGNVKSRLDKLSLRIAQLDVQLTWWGFGVIWLLVRSQLVSFGVGEALYTVCDVMTKFYFTMLLLNGAGERPQVDRSDGKSSLPQAQGGAVPVM